MIVKICQLFIVLLGFFSYSSYAQAPSIEWQKCYGSPVGDQCRSIQPTSDGGSIICGTSQSLCALVIKINATGSVIWQQNFPGTSANSIQQTADGGYIIAGYTAVAGNGNDFWVAQLNSTGIIIWQRTFGGTMNDLAQCVRQTIDGGFVVAGRILSSDGDITGYHGNGDGWILKLNNLGNLIWQKSLGGSDFDAAVSIIQTGDGGYIVGGTAVSSDGDVTNIYNSEGAWVVKLDNNGNIIWQKTYGSPLGVESIFGICITSDGNYAFVSGSYQNAGDITGFHGAEDLWVVKISTIGNIMWQRSIGGTLVEVPGNIFSTNDGGCVAVGYSYSNNEDVSGAHGASDFLVAKLSQSGTLEWTNLLGGNAHDRPLSVYQTTDNSYIVAGSTGSNNNGDVGINNGQDDYWVVKLSFDVTPVTLGNFTAIATSNDVVCKWQTLQEQDADHFIIERSEDGIQYITAGTIAATGNSSSPLWYQYTDKKILLSNYDHLYYRLKMVDIDGTFEHSNVVFIKLKHSSTLSIFPNPVIGILQADFTSATHDNAEVSILDQTGRKIFKKNMQIKPGKNSISLNTTFLSKGVYILAINGRNRCTAKFIKIVD